MAFPEDYVYFRGFWFGRDGSGPHYIDPLGTATALGQGTGNVRAGNAAPTGADATGVFVRRDPPFAGVMYFDGALINNSYTWATRPTPSASNLGCIITISDIQGGGDFVCKTFDGGTTYWWVPLSGRLRLKQVVGDTAHTGTTSETAVATDTIPGNLIIPNCTVESRSLWSRAAGGADTVTLRHRLGAVLASSTIHAGNAALATTVLTSHLQGVVYFSTQSAQLAFSPSSSQGFGTNTVGVNTDTENAANDLSLFYSAQLANGADTVTLKARVLDIFYPG